MPNKARKVPPVIVVLLSSQTVAEGAGMAVEVVRTLERVNINPVIIHQALKLNRSFNTYLE